MRHKPLQHIEIIFTFILSPANNHYLSHSSSFNSLHLFTFCFLTTSPPQLCERSAHYSKPAAKHFPRPRRRRRMALVSPCPLGDVQHPTYPKLTFKIRKSVKCDNPESCCAPSVKECLSLLSFPQLPPTHPRELPRPKVFKGVRDIWCGWTQNGKTNQTTFSSHVKAELFSDNLSVNGLQNILPRWVSAIASHKTPSLAGFKMFT